MNKFYTYFHINPVKNEIFYVGIGSNKRAYNKIERSKFWKDTVNKYGLIINIIDTNLTWKEACEKEIFYISKIGRKNLNKGPLVNLTNGGEGNYGIVVSEETRKKSSESHKGKKSNLGKKHTDEAKKKMSESGKGISRNKGKKHSQQSKINMSLAHIGKGVGRINTEETKKLMSEKAKLRELKKRQLKLLSFND